MASWVITIAKDAPEHWDYAKRDGVWDMPKHFPVARGDHVFFRLSGGPLLGWGRALEDARPLTARDEVPWKDGRDPYRSRFTFELVSDSVNAPSTWNRIGPRLSSNPPLQGPRRWTSPEDETVLASFFDTALEDFLGRVLASEPEQDTPAPSVGVISEDERKFVDRLQAVREGQAQFRSRLIAAYGACAVTGTQTEHVLEGAHILPYSGPQSNHIRNGLLLRRDIHRLFDAHLLTISETGRVQVAESITDEEYRDLDGEEARLPAEESLRPSQEYLATHRSKFEARQ